MNDFSVSPALTGRRILIAEDEPELAEILAAFLVRAGASVRVARDGEAAVDEARRWRPDLMLLDIRMPKRDGLSVMVAGREMDAALPIILISALGDDIDRLAGFRLGADDYVVKPFNPLEVIARVAAVLRRLEAMRHTASTPSRIVLDSLRIEVDSRRVFLDERSLNLTPTEFRLLSILARRPGRLHTRSELTEQALSEEALDRGIDAHMSRLRAKFGAQAAIRISAVRGEGYRLDVEP